MGPCPGARQSSSTVLLDLPPNKVVKSLLDTTAQDGVSWAAAFHGVYHTHHYLDILWGVAQVLSPAGLRETIGSGSLVNVTFIHVTDPSIFWEATFSREYYGGL